MQALKIIKHALDSTIELINKGEQPTIALEKVARELDLNPNYIQRTGELLNVALHYDHFKKASDKAADFDIADIPEVTANVFGEKEKTLAQKQAEWFPVIPEEVNYNKFLTNPKFKKAEAEIEATPANYDSFGITYKGQFKKASDHMNRLARELDEIQTEKVANDVYIEASFFSLVNGFKKEASSRTPFHEFETQIFAEYGDKSVPYLDLIYKSANMTEDRGTHDDKKINFAKCKEAEVFDSFMKAAANSLVLEKEAEDAETYVSEQKQKFASVGHSLNPLALAFEKAACDALADELEVEMKVYTELNKEAAGPGLIDTLFGKYKDLSSGHGNVSPNFKNTALDNRQRVSMLQELIMTDPILSKAPPEKVVGAYQQFIRLAPQLSKEKEVVGSKLREMVSTPAFHPVDANQLVEANTNLMKQDQMLHGTTSSSGHTPEKR